MPCAASEFHGDGRYVLAGEDKTYSSVTFPEYLAELVDAYPIVSIEDGMAEDDQSGWRCLTERLGQRVQLVGDDLFVTQTPRLAAGIQDGIANAILIKPNQVGTLSETLAAIRLALSHGYGAIVSHRSGETGDTTIADLAVAANCSQIKTGSLSRSDRVEKYNRLLQIERELGDGAIFAFSPDLKMDAELPAMPDHREVPPRRERDQSARQELVEIFDSLSIDQTNILNCQREISVLLVRRGPRQRSR